MYSDEELEELYYKKKSAIHGYGLFARKKIKKGDYMGEYDGPTVKKNGMHVLWVEEGESEDDWIGRDGKNLLRYLNHSKKPQAEFVGFELFATRDIKPDEEITINYGDEFEA